MDGQCKFQKPALGRYDAYFLYLWSEGQHLFGNLNIIKEEKKSQYNIKSGLPEFSRKYKCTKEFSASLFLQCLIKISLQIDSYFQRRSTVVIS